MFPILFSLGQVTISTFSVCLVIAFFATGYIFWRKGREEHFEEDEIFDAFLLSTLVGVVFGRVGYVILYFQRFGLHPLQWLDLFGSPGMVPLVGLCAAAAFLFRYAKKQKWNPFQLLDYGALAAAGGAAVVWFGSFLAGANFGSATKLPIGMYFPGVFEKRHPAQLYALIGFVVLYFFLNWAEYHYRAFQWYRAKKHSAQTGFLFAVFWMVYALITLALLLVMPAQFVLFGVAFDVPLRIVLFCYGALTLYFRSGRSLLFLAKSKSKQSVTNEQDGVEQNEVSEQ